MNNLMTDVKKWTNRRNFIRDKEALGSSAYYTKSSEKEVRHWIRWGRIILQAISFFIRTCSKTLRIKQKHDSAYYTQVFSYSKRGQALIQMRNLQALIRIQLFLIKKINALCCHPLPLWGEAPPFGFTCDWAGSTPAVWSPAAATAWLLQPDADTNDAFATVQHFKHTHHFTKAAITQQVLVACYLLCVNTFNMWDLIRATS